MIVIVIEQAQKTPRNVPNKKNPTAPDYIFYEQPANLHGLCFQGAPVNGGVKMNISLRDDQEPYPAGKYLLGDASFVLNFGRLELSRNLVLTPAVAAMKAAA